MVALMGPSGAGKTTLLDVLAGKKTEGYITGDLLVNGKPRDESFNRIAGCQSSVTHARALCLICFAGVDRRRAV